MTSAGPVISQAANPRPTGNNEVAIRPKDSGVGVAAAEDGINGETTS